MIPSPLPPRAAAVLQALWNANAGELSMQDLMRQTSIPLAGVQDALSALSQRGALIERTPTSLRLVNAGLQNWSDLITATAQKKSWKLGHRAIVLDATPSTNDIAWQNAGDSASHGTIVLANYQTAGRGRLGRAWTSKPDQSVLMSIVVRDVPANSFDRLTLLAGLATAVALERLSSSVPRIEIKWPNDLIARNRKLAGILLESRAPNTLVVGIGVNVAQAPHAGDFPPDLGGRAISLFESSGTLFDRLRVVLSLLEQLECHLALQDSHWIADWKSRCAMLGRPIKVRIGDRHISGQVLDVEPLQGLLVRDGHGHTHFLSSQTCSVVDVG